LRRENGAQFETLPTLVAVKRRGAFIQSRLIVLVVVAVTAEGVEGLRDASEASRDA
jgi:hypothetical protein